MQALFDAVACGPGYQLLVDLEANGVSDARGWAVSFSMDECRRRALLDGLVDEARRSGADLLVTTRKDHVKLAALRAAAPVWQVAVEMHVTAGAEELERKVLASAEAACGGGGGGIECPQP